MSREEHYANQTENMLSEIRRLLFQETNWTKYKEHQGISIFTTATPYAPKYRCFKGESIVQMSPDRIIDIVHPFAPYRFMFDPNVTSSECLEELSPTGCIAYQCIRVKICGIGIPGDSIDIFAYDKTDEYCFSVFQSVKYDKPFSKEHGTRGWIFPSGIAAFRTEDPNVSKVISVWNAQYQMPLRMLAPLVEVLTANGMIQYIQALQNMANAPYEPLGPEWPLCRSRSKSNQ